VNNKDKAELVELAKIFDECGFGIIATGNTYAKIVEAGIKAEKINKMQEGRPNILDAITNGQIQLIVNTPASKEETIFDDSYIRKAAIKGKIPYMTTMAAAKATAEGIRTVLKDGELGVKSLQEIHSEIK
ncbi:MAG: carbamoyl phosphate synthase large subunit, partial [Lachnospiraceae bacterium]|nr:carbamoyl phosphate synthase large subunit [Lachnospiraceae bacterium]